MATDLTGLKVKDTYNSLLKIGDNSSLSATPDRISDGLGNESALWLSTARVGIGSTPDSNYTLTVSNNIKTQSLDASSSITASSLRLTGGAGTQGLMSWNTDEETIDVVQNGAVLQLGQETHVHVKNQSGATINDGTPVYVTGTLGSSGRLTVAPMIADGSIEAKYFLGVTTEDIPNGEDGKVTTFGKIRGLNTSAYSEGQTLYVSASTAGFWQTTAPVAPNLDLEVAIVINVSANNGTIFVRAQQGHYLGMLHDVYLNSPVNNQFLVYNSTTSRWENQGIASVGSINLDSVTDNGNTTTNDITVGDITAGNMTLSGYLRGAGTFVIDPSPYADDAGVVQILGDLRVDGTTTTINSTTVTIDDKNIVLASGSATAADANGAGLTIDGASATMLYESASDRLVFNKDLEVTSGQIRVENDSTDIAKIVFSENTDQDVIVLEYNGVGTGDTNYFQIYSDVTGWAGKGDLLNIQPSTGRVAIGNTSFDEVLHVTGNVKATTFIGDLQGNADTATNADKVDNKHATDFTLDYITTNGNSTSNSIELNADGGATYAPLILANTFSGASYVRQDFITDTIASATTYFIAYGSGNGADGSLAIKNNASHTTTNGTAGDIWFATGASSTERMRISGSSGDVKIVNDLIIHDSLAIGQTTSPSQALHVNGNIIVGGQDHGFVHGGGKLAVSSDGDVIIVTDSNDTAGATPDGKIVFGGGSLTDTNSDQSFSFADAFGDGLPRNEWARLIEGKMGIGETDPDTKLHITEEGNSPVLLTLQNTQVSGDILNDGTTGNFIDFVSTDSNTNFTPQVRIGMVVQDYSGDGGISSEGVGNFVVYTSQGTDELGAGTLTESFRVREDNGIQIFGTNNDLIVREVSENEWHIYDTFQDNGIIIHSSTGGMEFQYNGVTEMTVDANGVSVVGGIDLSDANLDIGSADIVFGIDATDTGARGLVWSFDADGDTIASNIGYIRAGGTLVGEVMQFNMNAEGTVTGSDAIYEFKNAGTDILTIGQDGSLYITGNVGIKQPTPASTLDVNGQITSKDIVIDFNTGTLSHGLLFRGVSGSAGDVGIRANGEAFEIYEPEQSNRVWLSIADDPLGNGIAAQLNSPSGFTPILTNYNKGDYINKTYIDGLNVDADTLDGISSASFLRSDADDTMTSTLTIQKQISANGIYYPFIIQADDTGNTVDQLEGDGIGLQFKLANNLGSGSFLGGSIAAVRESGSDDNSSTRLEFYTSNNDETLDKQLTIDSSGSATIKRVRITATDDASNSSTLHGLQIGDTSNINLIIDINEILVRNNGANETLYIQNDGAPTSMGGNLTVAGTITGNGSGLSAVNATTLDNIDSSSFLRSDANDTASGDISFTGKVYVQRGSTAAQSYHDLYIGGDNLASADSAIYIGNRGDGTGYGWELYYAGTGSGNANRFQIKSENLGSPVTALDIYQDGTFIIPNSVGIGTTSPAQKLHVTGAAQIDNGGLILGGTSSVNGNNPQLRRVNSSNDLSIATNGSDRIRIKGIDGNVGIGTTSPAAKLEIYGTGNTLRLDSAANQSKTILLRNVGTATAEIKTDGNLKLWAEDAGRNIYFDTSGGTKMTILSNGNVGIGTDNPTDMLHLKSTGDVQIRLEADTDNVGEDDNPSILLVQDGGAVSGRLNLSADNNLQLINQYDGAVQIGQNNTPNFTIDNTGKFAFGSALSTASHFMHLYAETPFLCLTNTLETFHGIRFEDAQATTSQYALFGYHCQTNHVELHINGTKRFQFNSDGAFHADNDITAFSSSVSDQRLKDDIETIDNALEKVKALRGVQYVWNKGSRKGQKDLGVVAQEVESVLPEIVREKEMPLLDDSGEKYKTVDYEKMVGVLIEAIKEQQKQIDELKARLDA